MTSNIPITIVGGGLAGLCLANALNTVGINVEVFEAALELNEIGAAVNISPNATRVLQALRLNDEIEAAGDHGAGLFNRNMQTGDPIDTGKPKNGPAPWSSTQYRFHRADLLGILAKNVDPNSIRLGHRLISAAEYSDRVELIFSNGVTHDAKFVVGADGIRSLLRQTLYGDDNPSYTGQMVWRTLLPGRDVPTELLEPTGHIQWLGPGRHFLAYFIRRGELVNVVTQQDTSEWVDEGWSMPGDPDEMRLSFPNPEPRLAKILGLVMECSKWGLFTRPITENWGQGRIQLIGDAAHAMLPNAGQGACQGFEDGYILARWLDAVADPIEAFRNFRRVRIPRVHAVQRFSMAAAKFKHMDNADKQKSLIDGSRGIVLGDTAWISTFDPVADWDKDPLVPNIDYSDFEPETFGAK